MTDAEKMAGYMAVMMTGVGLGISVGALMSARGASLTVAFNVSALAGIIGVAILIWRDASASHHGGRDDDDHNDA